jgi:acetylornithine deacetylase/succinyl-diaminopimelate desuccinylase-like protein
LDPAVKMLSIDSDLGCHLTPMIGGSGPSYPFVHDLGLPVATAGLGYPETHAPNEIIRVDLCLKHARHMARILKEFAK